MPAGILDLAVAVAVGVAEETVGVFGTWTLPEEQAASKKRRLSRARRVLAAFIGSFYSLLLSIETILAKRPILSVNPVDISEASSGFDVYV